jgi:hypothetical protein
VQKPAHRIDSRLMRRQTRCIGHEAGFANDLSELPTLLIDSTFTLALLTGMSAQTVGAEVVANPGWTEAFKDSQLEFPDVLWISHPLTAPRCGVGGGVVRSGLQPLHMNID